MVKSLVACPYSDQLGIVLANEYHLGNMNASLFATEGVASVGPVFAPLSAFVCGLVIALGNKASAGLPGRFVLISTSVIPQILLSCRYQQRCFQTASDFFSCYCTSRRAAISISLFTDCALNRASRDPSTRPITRVSRLTAHTPTRPGLRERAKSSRHS